MKRTPTSRASGGSRLDPAAESLDALDSLDGAFVADSRGFRLLEGEASLGCTLLLGPLTHRSRLAGRRASRGRAEFAGENVKGERERRQSE